MIYNLERKRMMWSAFLTTAPIKAQGHGGGSSSYYELKALEATTEVKQVIDGNGKMLEFYPGNMFMVDYQSALIVEHNLDVAIFNGGPWSATMRAMRAHKTIVDCPAHNLRHSIEEHVRLMGNYPYMNMINPQLSKMQFQYQREADIIITQARISLQWLDDLGIHPRKAAVIPGGCHLPDVIPPLPERFGVGYLGSFGPDKGVTWLLEAWFKSGHKDADLVIAGNDSKGIASQLIQWNQFVSVKALGWVDDLTQFWGQISVYVQPSVTEGFGLEVLEAMSYGRPVIVTEGTGASEIVKHGEEGVIIPIRDIEAIISAINWFMAHPEEVIRMGANARKKAEQYTWARAQKAYEEIILS